MDSIDIDETKTRRAALVVAAATFVLVAGIGPLVGGGGQGGTTSRQVAVLMSFNGAALLLVGGALLLWPGAVLRFLVSLHAQWRKDKVPGTRQIGDRTYAQWAYTAYAGFFTGGGGGLLVASLFGLFLKW